MLITQKLKLKEKKNVHGGDKNNIKKVMKKAVIKVIKGINVEFVVALFKDLDIVKDFNINLKVSLLKVFDTWYILLK